MICNPIDLPLTLSRFYQETYGPTKHLGRSPATVESYHYSMRTWDRLTGDLPLSEITPQDVVTFLAEIAKTRSPATVNSYMRNLRAIMSLAQEHDKAHESWSHRSAKIPHMPETHDDPVAYLLEEIEAIVTVARKLRGKKVSGIPRGKWWPAMLLTMFGTGVRVSALMNARFDDLDLADEPTIVIRGETQKNNKGRRYKLIAEAADALRQMGAQVRDRLFPWPYDQQSRQWPTLTRHFRRILDAAGLKQPGHPFHQFRRSCASYTAAAGGEGLAQSQLGHASPSTTRAYLDPRIVHTQQAADVLPALFTGGKP